MSGQAAALGFEYQFLQTLDHALAALIDDRGDLTGVVVDAPPEGDPIADLEIVDFALMAGDRCRLAAQVKGGAPGSVMSAVDAVRVLLRLRSGTSSSQAGAITMNEVVQLVLFQELRDTDLFGGTLGLAAFHAQHWLARFIDQEDYPVAPLLRAHIIFLAEHALSADSTEYAVALLYGNASKLLNLTDSHELAVRYLRAEMTVLDQCTRDSRYCVCRPLPA
ncbi:hypothetical protein JOD54_000968 [Actinokineospora baliensis]|uniref:hypothetical protein n=1 Tax=Actinokineospora baliensis TaxID=547056 RepID=UPI00195ECEB0|nr:hypothetical protein [Actinokineospora baliensis]MBM7770764.1 hypothetical protein [Actinokineospora baliensis]